MAADPISLPTRLATRLVFDSVSYSNCLPPWRDDVDMDFADMDRHIRRRISEYLKGRNPSAPFTILVPKRNGSKKKWVIPSVMDQVILQTAVSELARPVSTLLDEKRVFSYRINKNPNKVQFTENQAASWTLFQETTQSRLKGPASSMLQMDLEGAFHSIDRPRFYDFLKRVSPSGIEVKLVEHLVESFAGHDPGLPLINDSLFFLGNAYLAVVDQVIQKQTPSFIRFVDDYRIFGSSNDGLERRFEQIDRALGDLGFKINMSKVKVGTRNDYFQ